MDDAVSLGSVVLDGDYRKSLEALRDTLAGFIAGLLARGTDPVRAAAWGVFLHGEAGNRLARSRGLLGYLAREIPDEVPAILTELC